MIKLMSNSDSPLQEDSNKLNFIKIGPLGMENQLPKINFTYTAYKIYFHMCNVDL